jgi:hypothetical protein
MPPKPLKNKTFLRGSTFANRSVRCSAVAGRSLVNASTGMAVRHITKRLVDALQPNQTVWDTEVRGFGVRRQRGWPSYVLNYRIRNRRRSLTVGTHGSPWTPELARIHAKELPGDVAGGVGPAVALGRVSVTTTVSELCDRYLGAGCAEMKASTLATDRGRHRATHQAAPGFTARGGHCRTARIEGSLELSPPLQGDSEQGPQTPCNIRRLFRIFKAKR